VNKKKEKKHQEEEKNEERKKGPGEVELKRNRLRPGVETEILGHGNWRLGRHEGVRRGGRNEKKRNKKERAFFLGEGGEERALSRGAIKKREG